MAKKTVYCDASPLIGLAIAGEFDLLRKLFGTVKIAHAVKREVSIGKAMPGAIELAAAVKAGWIHVVPNSRGAQPFPFLDPGEAHTLALAAQAPKDCLVLMDDTAGRKQAGELGLAVTGTAGLLLVAKRRGLIPALRPLFETLMNSDFRISAEVIRAVLHQVGET